MARAAIWHQNMATGYFNFGWNQICTCLLYSLHLNTNIDFLVRLLNNPHFTLHFQDFFFISREPNLIQKERKKDRERDIQTDRNKEREKEIQSKNKRDTMTERKRKRDRKKERKRKRDTKKE